MPDQPLPFPIIIQPSSVFSGQDGNWSTFPISIGAPPQNFSILPSLTSSEIWVPIEGACSPYPNFTDCTTSRGIAPSSQGFQSNESSTWSQIGIYGLSSESGLFGSADSGLYGLDTVSFGNGVDVRAQTVAAIATNNFWLGSIGLGIQPSQFDVRQEDRESLLVSMKKENLTASLSYGFAAGASYRSDPGGLIIGGYDGDAFTPSNISFPATFDSSRSLTVSLRGIVASNAPAGTLSLSTKALNMSLDSAVSQLWLPRTVCDAFAANLSLSYDSNTELYLINSTVRNQLLEASPEFTFTIAVNETTGETTNIVLPYAAFDLEIGPPTYNSSTKYFPIRRAANETQFVLGRTFLQEAYVVVDWERQNFTLGQRLHQNGVSNNIMPISPIDNGRTSSRLSGGAIAGIVVGAVAAIVLAGLAVWLWRRNRRTAADPENEEFAQDKKEPEQVDTIAELPSEIPAELMSEERHELPEEELKHHLMSNVVHELPGELPELDSKTPDHDELAKHIPSSNTSKP